MYFEKVKTINILHVASFTGNIGDNASHIGLSSILKNFFPTVTEKRLEIRRFYKNYSLPDKLYFDEDFVRKANTFDLLIIGGGGFLDYWVPNSETGTTIDISKEVFDKLYVPTLICSVGCIPHRNIPEGNERKFQSFLNHALSKKNVKILLRNDGSKEILDRMGAEYSSIPTILDNAFFFDINEDYNFKLINEKYVAINTTLDQLEMRGNLNTQISKEVISEELVSYIMYIIKKTDFHVVLVPHIFSDIRAFLLLLHNINDFYIRTKIHIAPYTQGDFGCKLLFSIYKKAEYCIGMRFHANVCNLAMNKPVSGLAVLDRVKYMHEYIGNNNFIVDINEGFSKKLFQTTLRYAGKELPKEIIANIEKAKTNSLYFYEKIFNEIL